MTESVARMTKVVAVATTDYARLAQEHVAVRPWGALIRHRSESAALKIVSGVAPAPRRVRHAEELSNRVVFVRSARAILACLGLARRLGLRRTCPS